MDKLETWIPIVLAVLGIIGSIVGRLQSSKWRRMATAVILGVEAFAEGMRGATVSDKAGDSIPGSGVGAALKFKILTKSITHRVEDDLHQAVKKLTTTK